MSNNEGKIKARIDQAGHIAEGFYRLAQEKLGVLPGDIASLAAARYATCMACEKFDKESDRCTICGCVMSAKTKVPDEQCPQGRWGRQERPVH